MRNGFFYITICLAISLLSGCFLPPLYQVKLEQGNQLNPEAIQSLRIGMTEAEIIKCLGSPLYQNLFDNHRLIYVHENRNGSRIKIERLILAIHNGRLTQIVENTYSAS